MKRLLAATFALALVGCSGGDDFGLDAADIEGYYSGDWGDMLLVRDGDQVRGTYSHDDGTLFGTYSDGVFVGWWCEWPSREADNDAGDVEFDFYEDETGIHLDGRWRYGKEGDMRENWDLDKSEEDPPEELIDRLNDASAFCGNP
jgi:hypothetical protein